MIAALRIGFPSLLILGVLASPGLAQERPYFITYDHHMEEPGNLEVATNPVIGEARGISTFIGNWTEFEYGAKGWWTSEFYVDSQHTLHDGGLLTGFRFENRFRLLLGEHRINPVLYVEYEHINGADKTLKEVVGFDRKEGYAKPNWETRLEHEGEFETKLILSSQIKGWNVSEKSIMRRHPIQIIPTIVLFVTVVYAKSCAEPSAENPFQNSDSARAAGQKLFARHCAECHGPAADGTERAPSLREFVRSAAP